MDRKRVFCKFSVEHVRDNSEEDVDVLENHEISFETTEMHIDRFLEKCEQIARACEFVVPEGSFVFERPMIEEADENSIENFVFDNVTLFGKTPKKK
jgi:hypothetical protein